LIAAASADCQTAITPLSPPLQLIAFQAAAAFYRCFQLPMPPACMFHFAISVIFHLRRQY